MATNTFNINAKSFVPNFPQKPSCNPEETPIKTPPVTFNVKATVFVPGPAPKEGAFPLTEGIEGVTKPIAPGYKNPFA